MLDGAVLKIGHEIGSRRTAKTNEKELKRIGMRRTLRGILERGCRKRGRNAWEKV